jgi:hypothetical protein
MNPTREMLIFFTWSCDTQSAQRFIARRRSRRRYLLVAIASNLLALAAAAALWRVW